MNAKQASDLVLSAARLVCGEYVAGSTRDEFLKKKHAIKARDCIRAMIEIERPLRTAMFDLSVSEERRVLLDCLSESAHMLTRCEDLIEWHKAAFDLIHPQLMRVMEA